MAWASLSDVLPLRLRCCNPCGAVVDAVRSCYRGYWNLPPLGSDSVAGRYVFAPSNAKPVPFLHYFGSRHWLTEDERAISPLGDAGPLLGDTDSWENGAGYPSQDIFETLGGDCYTSQSSPCDT